MGGSTIAGKTVFALSAALAFIGCRDSEVTELPGAGEEPSQVLHVVEGTTRGVPVSAEFSPSGVVSIRNAGNLLELSWVDIGRAAALDAPATILDVETESDGARYDRGDYTEWYVLDGRGVEQGFTFATRPPGRAGDALVLGINVGSSVPTLERAATPDEHVALRDQHGQVKFRYRGLYVTDATGRRLTARLEVVDVTIRIVIDDAEAEYPVVVDPLILSEVAKFYGTPAAASDLFGAGGLAVDGDTLIVGVPNNAAVSALSGATFVFVQVGGTWMQEAMLLPQPPENFAAFGRSVDLDADRAIVGAPLQSVQVGGADIFVRSGSVWTHEQHFVGGVAPEELGTSVAIDGDTAVIGVPGRSSMGAASVYTRVGATWTLQQELVASDAALNDQFGASVDLEGDTIVVGAPLDDDGAADNGSAYVFVRSVGVWAQQAKLLASDLSANAQLGSPVVLDGDTALLTAANDNGQAGAVYAFIRVGSMWSQQAKLVPTDLAPSAHFGGSISLRGDDALIGRSSDDVLGSGSGSAYVFSRVASTWTQSQKILASDGVSGDNFGAATALGAGFAVVTAPGDDDLFNLSGAAYSFATLGNPCVLATECLSGFCADGVCCDTACGGSVPGDCFACDVVGAVGLCSPEAGASCGDPTNAECDAPDSCDGAGVCQQNLATSGAACGSPLASECDTPDTCDGSGACQVNPVQSGDPCGDQSVPCHVNDACDGLGSCADSGFLNVGTQCLPGAECVQPGLCDVLGQCVSGPEPAGALCGDPTSNDCNGADTCDGSGLCLANVPLAGAPCGDPTSGECNIADSCDGVGACLANIVPSGTACGDSTNSECTLPDACDGLGSCLSNHASAGAVCGDQDVLCHLNDGCDGLGSCGDAGLLARGTSCGPGSGECILPSACDASGACLEVLAEAGTPCGDPQQSVCNSPDTCDGVGTCAINVAPVGMFCGPPGCDLPIVCDASGACMGDCPDGTYCDGAECFTGIVNGQPCTEDKQCDSGACSDGICCNQPCDNGGCGSCWLPGQQGTCVLHAAGTVCRGAGDAACDTVESCDGATSLCPQDVVTPNGSSCDGGTCQGGFCEETLVPLQSSCGCSVAGEKHQKEHRAWFLAMAVLALARGRRRGRAA
jgi:MYXO-CTERM domain-containing protein